MRKTKDPSIVPTPQGDFDSTYDIYLTRGADQLPKLDNLLTEAPVLQEPDLPQRMLQHSTNVLKVALPENKAIELLQRLQAEGAKGSLLPSAYRQPRISAEQAVPIAEKAIAEIQAKRRPNDTPGTVRFLREQPTCWTFGAVSEQLIREGRIPGLFYASVDKLDGHIWKPEEFDRLAGEG